MLEGLDDRTLAQLLAARSPKPKDADAGLTESLLTLERSLGMLPSVEDLSKELNRVKLELGKAQTEAAMADGVIATLRERLQDKDAEARKSFDAALQAMRDGVRGYLRDCVVKEFPVGEWGAGWLWAKRGNRGGSEGNA